jgi:hypothetical protein
MSKLQKFTYVLVVLSLLMVVAAPANAQGILGCKTFRFIGSYTRTIPSLDVWGDGSAVAHTFLYQLTLSIDGSAIQEYTGGPDIMLSGGLATTSVGSWKCRSDGKLVVALIGSAYAPTRDAINHPTTVPYPPPIDLLLASSQRLTYLFTVTNENTLSRIQARVRTYLPAEDPADPNAGTLGPLSNISVTYKRVLASDADLLAP